METLDHIIDRLKLRQASVEGLTCIWCPCCLRVQTHDTLNKLRNFDLIWSGDDDCRNRLKHGSIAKCLEDLSELRAGR